MLCKGNHNNQIDNSLIDDSPSLVASYFYFLDRSSSSFQQTPHGCSRRSRELIDQICHLVHLFYAV